MIIKNILSVVKLLTLILFIAVILLTFWISVLKASFYIPIQAMYYVCEKPYISAYKTNRNEVLNTLQKKDYCVDIAIPFINHMNVRESNIKYQYLILDSANLIQIKIGSKHTFFKDPIKRDYKVIQKDIGYFYLDYSQNWENPSKSKSLKTTTVKPKIKLNDKNLKEVLFSD